jgi:hypothetical protein
MRNVCVVVAAIIAVASTSSLSAGAGAIRISQVYPGGGGAPDGEPQSYLTDYVELFNASGSPVDVSGWILAYGGPTPTPNYGCAGCTGQITVDTIIGPCSYLLVKVGPTNTHGSSPDVPSADLVLSAPRLDYVIGSLGLFSVTPWPSGICPTLARQDLVAWSSICNEHHSVAAPTDRTRALVRLGEGMTDTDDNQADFVVLSGPTPRNTGSPQNPLCLQTPTQPATWGRIKVIHR